MKLSDAVDAHLQSSVQLSVYGDRRELISIGRLKALRDAPGRKRPPRLQTILICGVPPAEAMESVRAYQPSHWILSVVDRMDADHDTIKESYKACGYRLNIRFPVFIRELAGDIPDAQTIIRRVNDQDVADSISALKRRKLLPPAAWQGEDPLVRIYAAMDGDQVIGWVESIRATRISNWVSDLFVLPNHRGRGIGKSLLQFMLRDDLAHGVKNSALLSSSDGRNLYPKAGYKQIGLMQIFAPIKRRS